MWNDKLHLRQGTTSSSLHSMAFSGVHPLVAVKPEAQVKFGPVSADPLLERPSLVWKSA